MNDNKKIHVCYESTKEFAMITATSIISIFENTQSKVVIHINYGGDITDEDKNNFHKIAHHYGQEIYFYNYKELTPNYNSIAEKYIGKLARFGDLSIGRLSYLHFLPKEIHKLIHLGGDTIINIDIKELYNEPLGENGIASVSESEATFDHMVNKAIINDGTVKKENYFCDDVMVLDMNLHRKRINFCTDGCDWMLANPKYDCGTQDIANKAFSENYYHLPVKYDMFVDGLRINNIHKISDGIYHYAGSAYRFLDTNDVYAQLFMKFFVKTPWFNEKILAKILSEAISVRYRLDINTFNIINGKKIVFCGNSSTDIKKIQASGINNKYGMFFHNIYADDNTVSLNNLCNKMEEEKNADTIFLILSESYLQIENILTHQGFTPGIHFLDGNLLLNNSTISKFASIETIFNE